MKLLTLSTNEETSYSVIYLFWWFIPNFLYISFLNVLIMMLIGCERTLNCCYKITENLIKTYKLRAPYFVTYFSLLKTEDSVSSTKDISDYLRALLLRLELKLFRFCRWFTITLFLKFSILVAPLTFFALANRGSLTFPVFYL